MKTTQQTQKRLANDNKVKGLQTSTTIASGEFWVMFPLTAPLCIVVKLISLHLKYFIPFLGSWKEDYGLGEKNTNILPLYFIIKTQ